MKNLTAINKIRLLLGVILTFLISYILGVSFIIPIVLLVLFSYLEFVYKNTGIRAYKLLNILFLFVINFSIACFLIRRGFLVSYIPFTAVIMLSAILFGRPDISLIINIASAVTISVLTNNNFSSGLIFFIGGVLASILVMDVRRRTSFISAGFLVGIAQAIIVLVFEHFDIHEPSRYLAFILNGIISSMFVLGTLPIFEYLFKTMTNISLLELADFNQPLLQRLVLEAPGTYHHSLIVGNLSEAACRAVNTNALLSRIGAYYHDIGKLEKPEYFSENQLIETSKHDAVSPTISKLIIMNHVKEGMDLARRHKLNPILRDFISEHHGTSLVYYFYRRALESQEKEHQDIKEEGFRYPGPKPKSKETAIVLLADSVEAASRSLREPTPANVADLVHKIINNKFIDGQLDECELTLKDLEKIAAVFIRILSSIYHSRITYPEKAKSSENNHTKSPKENSHLSPEDKKGRS
jgi:putative nucleotidyltransferase with HDIG domain